MKRSGKRKIVTDTETLADERRRRLTARGFRLRTNTHVSKFRDERAHENCNENEYLSTCIYAPQTR